MPLSPNSRRFDRCVTSTATPAATRPSSRRMAFLTATPRPAASEVAEISGAAASTSTAAAACELRRRPATADRAANQARSRSISSCRPSAASVASARRNAGSQADNSNDVSARSAAAPVSGTGSRSSLWRVQKRISAARIGGRVPPESNQAWTPRAAASRGVSPPPRRRPGAFRPAGPRLPGRNPARRSTGAASARAGRRRGSAPRSMMRSAPSMRSRNPCNTAARCQGSISWPSTAAWRRTASSRAR